jgi:hypothetical protein
VRELINSRLKLELRELPDVEYVSYYGSVLLNRLRSHIDGVFVACQLLTDTVVKIARRGGDHCLVFPRIVRPRSSEYAILQALKPPYEDTYEFYVWNLIQVVSTERRLVLKSWQLEQQVIRTIRYHKQPAVKVQDAVDQVMMRCDVFCEATNAANAVVNFELLYRRAKWCDLPDSVERAVKSFSRACANERERKLRKSRKLDSAIDQVSNRWRIVTRRR